jgi:hypothetical protein
MTDQVEEEESKTSTVLKKVEGGRLPPANSAKVEIETAAICRRGSDKEAVDHVPVCVEYMSTLAELTPGETSPPAKRIVPATLVAARRCLAWESEVTVRFPESVKKQTMVRERGEREKQKQRPVRTS